LKTSNKILLGTLITALLLFGSLYAAVYIKFKKGDYIANAASCEIEVKHNPEKISYVMLRDVGVYLHNAEKPGLQFTKLKVGKAREIKYEQRGDSLLVYSANNGSDVDLSHSAKLYISKDVEVHAVRSYISLPSTTDSTKAPSFSLELDNSKVSQVQYSPTHKAHYDRLQIKAGKRSEIQLYDAIISKASLLLEQSSLMLYGCTVNQLNLENDQSSAVNFSNSSISWQQK